MLAHAHARVTRAHLSRPTRRQAGARGRQQARLGRRVELERVERGADDALGRVEVVQGVKDLITTGETSSATGAPDGLEGAHLEAQLVQLDRFLLEAYARRDRRTRDAARVHVLEEHDETRRVADFLVDGEGLWSTSWSQCAARREAWR